MLYTDKWQHFPISFTFTDQLVPAIAERIIIAPVRLPPGSLVLVGPEAGLSTLELAIWKRIQSEVALCPLPVTDIAAYRVASGTNCGGD